MPQIHARINFARRHIAFLTLLIWEMAEMEDMHLYHSYRAKRAELSVELNSLIAMAYADGRLSEPDARRANMPIESVESASVFSS